MLTDEDINKLTSVLASKEDFNYLKNKVDSLEEDIGNLKANVQSILVTLDKNSEPVTRIEQENAMTTGILTRHEHWIKEIAKISNINLSTE